MHAVSVPRPPIRKLAPRPEAADTNGQADIMVSFPAAGYYRIAATGPGGSKGWLTLDVGVTPDTAP
jgi:hypothetical protein